MKAQTIYTKVLNELDKRYIFTRYGLERRYNNLLKLRQLTVDKELFKLISEVLDSYQNLKTESCEIDIDTFYIRNYPYMKYSHTAKEITAIINSKISRANLRSYCKEAQKTGCNDATINQY